MNINNDKFFKKTTRARTRREFNSILSESEVVEFPLTSMDWMQCYDTLSKGFQTERIGHNILSGGFGRVLLCSEENLQKLIDLGEDAIVGVDKENLIYVRKGDVHFALVPLN